MIKNIILLMVPLFFMLSCSYPTTSFWVHNNTNRQVDFSATAYKPGFQEMTLPFHLSAGEKVLLRRIGLAEKGTINDVFSKIYFLKLDSITMKDPMQHENWIKSTDEKGNKTYIFNIKND